MLIECPNCGKKTFDDYKCSYCKYVLKHKANDFDPIIYKFLYDDYTNTNNKAISIKNGVAQFNKPMSEIKEIVDFVADEIYEKNNYREKEEVNINGIRYNTYHFSLIQYFVHNVIYKVMFVVLLLVVPVFFREVYWVKNNPGILLIWYGLVFLICLYLIFDWLKTSTSVIEVDFHEIRYIHRTINRFDVHHNDVVGSRLAWASYVQYELKKMTKVKVTLNSIIIYGDIVRTQRSEQLGGTYFEHKTQRCKRLRINKCFKNNSKLIKELKSRIKM